jgi:peptidoglycan/xylan/chitin deacetylase (PgdA/CDA1 family)
MRPFLVCIHDATPAHARETRIMLRDLAPLLGRRLSVGVVPDWDGAWPLAAHADYCALLRESADELLLHGYRHRRARGWGPATLLAERSDEMSGLDGAQTREAIARGQRAFLDAFGVPARGFLAPAWQRGHVRAGGAHAPGIAHVLGFRAAESVDARVPLATWSWDCGRWGWLGHVGHGIGTLGQALGRGVPSLALHPRDLERGFWPRILRLVRTLIDEGREPTTVAALLGARSC